MSVSDRHAYKYRCAQCSLAFRTLEKLQLHSHYHMVRAATMCPLCQRNFRSRESLQRHVESEHKNSMSEKQLAQFQASLATMPPLGTLTKKPDSDSSPDSDSKCKEEEIEEIGDEITDKDVKYFDEYMNNKALAEDSYNNPAYKFKCHRCKVAFAKQVYLSAHNKTLMHRRGDKFSYTMEKYMDPNRPYKCDTCKFDRKNFHLKSKLWDKNNWRHFLDLSLQFLLYLLWFKYIFFICIQARKVSLRRTFSWFTTTQFHIFTSRNSWRVPLAAVWRQLHPNHSVTAPRLLTAQLIQLPVRYLPSWPIDTESTNI